MGIVDKTVKIISIEWLSKSAEEALLCITDGIHECLVYEQPSYNIDVGTLVYTPLLAMNVLGVVVENTSNVGFSKMSGYFDYEIIAEVVDTANEIVKVGEIFIDIKPSLPGDIESGNIVSFTCTRLVFMG